MDDLTKRSDIESWGFCVVVDHDNVVHGVLVPAESTMGDSRETAGEVMRLAPTTRRPGLSVADAREDLGREEADYLLITNPEGQLWGVLLADDLSDDGKTKRSAQP